MSGLAMRPSGLVVPSDFDSEVHSDEYGSMASGLLAPRALLDEEFAAHSWALNDHGLAVPRSMAAKRPTCVDLFCGCGGFSLGMMQAGFEIVAAVEWDTDAAATYMWNLGWPDCELHFIEPEDDVRLKKAITPRVSSLLEPHYASDEGLPRCKNFFFGDIRKLKGSEILKAAGLARGELDCVVGGPPCQGFSVAGKRQPDDFRNSLVFEFCRLVIEMRPKTMVMENVPGILSMKTAEGMPVVEAIVDYLETEGFGTYESLRQALTGMPSARAVARGDTMKKRPKQKRHPANKVAKQADATKAPIDGDQPSLPFTREDAA